MREPSKELSGVIELDVHGMTQVQAQVAIDAKLRRATSGTYRVRIVHGYHGGTALRDMIRARYAAHPKVKRVEMGLNPGITELVLREYCV